MHRLDVSREADPQEDKTTKFMLPLCIRRADETDAHQPVLGRRRKHPHHLLGTRLPYFKSLTTRKPKSPAWNFGVKPKRRVARLYWGPLSQEPPRRMRLLHSPVVACASHADPSAGAPL